jgi:hypothetical protein
MIEASWATVEQSPVVHVVAESLLHVNFDVMEYFKIYIIRQGELGHKMRVVRNLSSIR